MENVNGKSESSVTEVIQAPSTPEKFYTDSKERTVIEEITAELKPFETAFRNALKRRGFNTSSMPFENVVMAFYNEFAKGKNPALPVTYLSEHPLSDVKVSQFDAVDNFDVIATAKSAVTLVKGTAKSIRDKAKAKKAQKIANAGGYDTLTPYQKSLINKPEVVNAPITKEELKLGEDVDKAVTKLEQKEQNQLSVTEGKLKSIIIGVVIFGFLVVMVWFFTKRK